MAISKKAMDLITDLIGWSAEAATSGKVSGIQPMTDLTDYIAELEQRNFTIDDPNNLDIEGLSEDLKAIDLKTAYSSEQEK